MVRVSIKVLALVVCTFAFSAVAQAQATGTWVSGVGDDVNPCSRTAPCKTFAGAISKTATNGEINCLDPGGFGAVTITKSITIDCEDTQGRILASNTNGVVINLTANPDTTNTVRLRGLSINGSGSSGITGIRGILVSSANTKQVKLFLDEIFIQNFINEGVFFNGPGGDLVVRDSLITNINGAGGQSGAGIRTLSTLAGATGVIHVSVMRTTTHLSNQGVRFEGNSFGVVVNSTASNNTLNGFVVLPVSIGGAEMNITDSIANNNRQFGVFSGGTGQVGVVRIFNLTAFHNTTRQLEVTAGGSILSNTRNHIGVPTDAPGAFVDQ
jgi:hypothetical protein